MKSGRLLLILVLLQLGFILDLRANFLTDWDSYLYTYSALHFKPVGLAGGRWFFTALLGTVWQGVNLVHALPADSAWMVFSATTVIFALLNVVLFFNLARRWLEPPVALIATSLFLASPMIGLYGSAVMTETFTLTALLASLLLLTRPETSLTRLVGSGLFFGLGCAIREPLILLVVLPLGLIGERRSFSRWPKVGLFLLTVFAVVALNFLLVHLAAENWQETAKSWAIGMARERVRMMGGLAKMLLINFLCLIAWLTIFSPVLLLTIPEQIRVFRDRDDPWLIPILLAVGLYCLGLIANHSLVFNPRFILFPAVLLCFPAAQGLWRKIPTKFQNEWVLSAVLIALHFFALTLCQPFLQRYYFDKSQAARETFHTLSYAPQNALFIPGRLTPVVDFYKNLHATDWRIIYAGWDFSDKELIGEIEKSRDTRRQVYLVDPPYWAEKNLRPLQYDVLQDVWDRYPHRPGYVAHFSQLELPPAQAPAELFRRLLNYLFS